MIFIYLIYIAYYSTWITRSYAICRYIFRYDASGSDNASCPYCHPLQHYAISSYPHIILNCNGCALNLCISIICIFNLLSTPCYIIHLVNISIHNYTIPSNIHMIANGQSVMYPDTR